MDSGLLGKDFFKTVIDAFAIVLDGVPYPRKAKEVVLLLYERLPESSEAFIHIAIVRAMLACVA